MANTPGPQKESPRLRSTPLQQDVVKNSPAGDTISSDEAIGWDNATKAEIALHSIYAMRERDYQQIKATHQAQDKRIIQLTEELSNALTTKTWVTVISVFVGISAAIVPIASILIPAIKEVISVETVTMVGGIMAGALVPIAIWVSRKAK